MKQDAVLHIPMSEYCCGLDERRIVYRLRCARDDLKHVTLFYADTACRVNPILFTAVPMEKILSDTCHDYWQVIVESPYNRVYYYFQLDDGEQTTLYYSGLFTNQLAQDRSEYFKLPFNHRADIARVPEWVRDAVVYNIFPDSFASGKCRIAGPAIRGADPAGPAGRDAGGRDSEYRLPEEPWHQLRLLKSHLRRRGIPQVRSAGLLSCRPLLRR